MEVEQVLHPALPTVGRIVHFYCKNWNPVGPYAAIVSRVDVVSTFGDHKAAAVVGLVVAGMGRTSSRHNAVTQEGLSWMQTDDVPGVVLGAQHDHDMWWQWPTRS